MTKQPIASGAVPLTPCFRDPLLGLAPPSENPRSAPESVCYHMEFLDYSAMVTNANYTVNHIVHIIHATNTAVTHFK